MVPVPGRWQERLAAPAAGVSAVAFAALSALRGRRFFHPEGLAFEGEVALLSGSVLPLQGTHRALIRFSRGIGLPDAFPDVLGVAVKIADLGQDLLFATSGVDAVTRHLLLPSSGFFRRPYSSVLPYRTADRSIVLGARPDESLLDVAGQQMEDLPAHARKGRLRFELTLAETGSRAVSVFGSFVAEREFDGDLAFNPFNSHPDLMPAGALNRLRLETYKSSQAARPDTDVVA